MTDNIIKDRAANFYDEENELEVNQSFFINNLYNVNESNFIYYIVLL